MFGGGNKPGVSVDLSAVRDALRVELTSRGHVVGGDTVGLRSDLFILGPNDLARALFVFHHDAGIAAESMYRSSGSWVAGMPPRFAVLPASEVDNPAFEMLEQIRAVPLLFEVDGRVVSFPDIDRRLAESLEA